MKTKTVVRAIHGSHLYHLNNENSDRDYYEVFDFLNQRHRPHKRKQSKHKLVYVNEVTEDSMTVSLDRFTSFCYAGVPQALETLYSAADKWIDFSSEWEEISYNAKQRVVKNLNTVLSRYKRAVVNFIKNDDFKKNRHAFRLCFNATELKKEWSMNPTLSDDVIDKITTVCKLSYEYRLKEFRKSWFSIFDDVE